MVGFFEQKEVPLDALKLTPMASGNQALLLSARITWEGFSVFAHALARLLRARIVERDDFVAERLWTLVIEGQRFWLVFDDYPLGVSLEPQDEVAGKLVPTIFEDLLRHRTQRSAR